MSTTTKDTTTVDGIYFLPSDIEKSCGLKTNSGKYKNKGRVIRLGATSYEKYVPPERRCNTGVVNIMHADPNLLCAGVAAKVTLNNLSSVNKGVPIIGDGRAERYILDNFHLFDGILEETESGNIKICVDSRIIDFEISDKELEKMGGCKSCQTQRHHNFRSINNAFRPGTIGKDGRTNQGTKFTISVSNLMEAVNFAQGKLSVSTHPKYDEPFRGLHDDIPNVVEGRVLKRETTRDKLKFRMEVKIFRPDRGDYQFDIVRISGDTLYWPREINRYCPFDAIKTGTGHFQ
jgi:hypothetical protein